jgi:hypothetical protein
MLMDINPNLIESRERERERLSASYYDDVKNVEGGNKNNE